MLDFLKFFPVRDIHFLRSRKMVFEFIVHDPYFKDLEGLIWQLNKLKFDLCWTIEDVQSAAEDSRIY